jgi:hypothetical protein
MYPQLVNAPVDHDFLCALDEDILFQLVACSSRWNLESINKIS